MATRKPDSKSQPKLFFSCEHAGNRIPAKYKKLFEKNQGVLQTHRGSDPGALEIGQLLAKFTKTKLSHTKISRLVVDMNRSPSSPTALSRWTKSLTPDEQQEIFDKMYWPYRKSVYREVFKQLKSPKNSKVIHFGIHSFSPYLDSSRKGCDIGILFDPKSRLEAKVAQLLRANLETLFPDLGMRMNFPYRGDEDGLTTDLRNVLGSRRYAGLEIEFNQAFLRKLKKRKSLRSFAFGFFFGLEAAIHDL